jgi:myosin heavy subunit
VSPSRFLYLSKSGCYEVEDMNDASEFDLVLNAMKAMNISELDRENICKIIAGILHLGNVTFTSDQNHYAQPNNMECELFFFFFIKDT